MSEKYTTVIEDKKICFSDLSGWLKAGIIGGWIVLIVYAVSFIAGIFWTV